MSFEELFRHFARCNSFSSAAPGSFNGRRSWLARDSRYQEGGRQQKSGPHGTSPRNTWPVAQLISQTRRSHSGRRANPRSQTCCLGAWRPDPSQHQNDGIVLQICLVDAGSGGQGLDGALSQSSLGRVPSSPKTRCYVSLRGNRREAACSNLQGVMLSLVIVSITSVSLEGHTKKLLETNIARIRAALRIITHIHSSSTSHSLWNMRKASWCGQRGNSWLCRRRRVQYTVPYLTSVLYALAQTNSVLFGFCDGAIVAAPAERPLENNVARPATS